MSLCAQVPASYEPAAADDGPDLSPGERQPPLPQPPPRFRPGDFRWRLAERAIGFLSALAASGVHGAGWAAASAPPLRALLAANASLRSMLRLGIDILGQGQLCPLKLDAGLPPVLDSC